MTVLKPPGSEEKNQPCFPPIQLEFYKQGSDSCRNYSQLTQRVRTVALIAAIAAIATPLSNLVDLSEINDWLILLAGALLATAALSLMLVDWHYQSAFEAKRDCLALIEVSLGQKDGPWKAHFDVRGSLRDSIASYLPFALLFACAIFAVSWALGSMVGVMDNPECCLGLQIAYWVIAGVAILGAIIVIWFAIAGPSCTRYEDTKKRIDCIQTKTENHEARKCE